MIHNKNELVYTLKHNFFQMSKKLAVVEYVWNVKIKWNPKLEQNPYLQKLNSLACKYKRHFERDMKFYSSSQFDYELLFAEELENIRSHATI